MSELDFYFDFSSPYAYLASFQIDSIAEKHGLKARWRPIMLGAAFKATGNQALVAQPLKGDYAKRDWERQARLYQLPFAPAKDIPILTLHAARAYWWLVEGNEELAKLFAQAIFMAFYVQSRDISDKEVVADVAAEMGINRTALLLAIADPMIKDRLIVETNQAIDRGVFGAPFFFVKDEPFWGGDRLWMLDLWLDRGGW